MQGTRLYTKAEVEEIRSKLKAGELKFSVSGFKCLFTKSKGYLIQRIHNKFLGLVYFPETDNFVYNYPHIDNIRAAEIASVQSAYFNTKFNGTNFRVCRVGDKLVYGTRGTVSPERFPVDVNTAILQGKDALAGVAPDVFKKFKTRYEPILKEGIAKGYVDDFGDMLIQKVAAESMSKFEQIFTDKTVVAVFSELTSRYNPICVNPEMDAGIYLGDVPDYKLTIFDVLVEDEDGYSFLPAEAVRQLPVEQDPQLSVADATPFTPETAAMFLAGTHEEGLMVKSPARYYKMKRTDVLEWERMMGTLSTVIDYSIAHTFDQEYQFTGEEILGGVFLNQATFEEITNSVWQEVSSHGITREQLVEFYISKGRSEDAANDILNHSVADGILEKVLLAVAPVLKSKGIPKEKLFAEIPKVIRFNREPTYFDEKKQKTRAYDWYSKLVGSVIGRCYLS